MAPTSLGWLTGWRSRGFYVDETVSGLQKRGMAPASYVPNPYEINPRSFKDGWEEAAMDYRIAECWDCQTRDGDRTTILQCATALICGRGLHVGYNWWGHSVEITGMKWTPSEQNNITWIIRNSHGETKPIELTGSRGIPDEAYAYVSSYLET